MRRALPGAVAAALLLAAPALSQSGGGDALVRQQRMEEEIRRLNGRIEQLEHRLTRIAEDAAQRIGALESQVFELQGGDPSLLGAPTPLGGLASAAPAGGTGDGTAPVVAVSEQAAFDDALRRVQRGDPTGGRAALRRFRADYPDSPLAGEAQHWIAESLFLDHDYRQAAQIYFANVNEHPRGRRASESLIGLALSLEKLGQIEEACLSLAEAPVRNPGDQEALARAESERQRLGCQ